MDIRFRLYPHPVLSSVSDDYRTGITFSCDVKKGIRELVFTMDSQVDDQGILDLIANGQAEYAYHIECPLTSFRLMIKSEIPWVTRHIPERDLNGQVSVCCFVIAKEDLVGYSNPNFNADYAGLSFDIDRGSILGIGGQCSITVTKEIDDLAKIPSIFSICRSADDSDTSMKINVDSDKIAIILNSTNFQSYKVMISMPTMISVFHSMIIMPALIYVFEMLRREGIDEYMNKRWCQGLRKALERSDVQLNADTLENIPSFELAQKILDLPVNRALRDISSAGENESEDE